MDELIATLSDQQVVLSSIGVPFSNQLSLTVLQAFFERNFIDNSDSYKYFRKYGLTRKNFNLFSSLERKNDDQKIPNITIDGKNLGMPGVYLMKIDVMDELQAARAGCLGKLTKCCQSLSGEDGQPCAIHGLTSPNGGFYIVCQGDVNDPKIDDPLLGQCWAWRSQNNAIVFDSIESSDKENEDLAEKIAIFYNHLGKILVEQGHTDKVACGKRSGISSYVGEISISNVESFIDYEEHSDAKKQRVIFDKNDPFYAFAWDEQSKGATLEKIKSILQNELPLGQSKDFCKIINWAILSGKIDLNDIKKLAEDSDRLKEMEELISKIESIISQDLSTVMHDIEDNEALVNIVDRKGKTALIQAACNGNNDICLKLIEKGADLNAKNNNGETALMEAAFYGHSDICLKLIEKGADVNSKDNNGWTALINAASRGHSDVCLKLIDKGAIVNTQNNYGNTPLMKAASEGHSDTCLALIERDANFNAKNSSGKTALMQAASNKRNDVCLKLIEKGVDVNVVDNKGKTALMQAASNGLSHICLELIKQGANINAKDNYGRTALIRAASNKYGDVCLKLIEKGADVNPVDKYGNTALMHAAVTRSHNVCLKLIERNTNVNAANKIGETALMLAAYAGLSDVCSALIKKGANINSADKYGNTALMRATASGQSDLCLELIEEGANVHDQNNDGLTTLMLAASYGLNDVCFKLIEKGVDVNAKDNYGNTALKLAMLGQQSHLCLELIKRGAAKNDEPHNINLLKKLLGDSIFNDAIAYQEFTDTLRNAMLNELSSSSMLTQSAPKVETVERGRKSVLLSNPLNSSKKLQPEQLIEKLNKTTDLATLMSTWKKITKHNADLKLDQTLLSKASSLLQSTQKSQKDTKKKLGK